MLHTSALAVLALPLILLTACTTATDGTSLAETKSPVQLLRNAVAARIPGELLRGAENTDASESCDGDEMLRAWHSSVTLDVDTTGTEGMDALVDTLSASFEDDGWVSTPGNDRLDYKQAYFTGGVSGVQIQVSVLSAQPGAEQILVNVIGACVLTDGPDSDEVTSLEGLS